MNVMKMLKMWGCINISNQTGNCEKNVYFHVCTKGTVDTVIWGGVIDCCASVYSYITMEENQPNSLPPTNNIFAGISDKLSIAPFKTMFQWHFVYCHSVV